MGWHIAEVENTVEISRECAEELAQVRALNDRWGGPPKLDWFVRDGRLYFEPDHMEHMDYVWEDEVQAVLLKHGARGDICFGSLDGGNTGEFWGYRFTQQGVVGLKGTLHWTEVED